MTANWPKSSSIANNKGIDSSATNNDDTEEDEGDGLAYHFYYRPVSTSNGPKNTLVDKTKYTSIKSVDDNTLETVLPGMKGVIFIS